MIVPRVRFKSEDKFSNNIHVCSTSHIYTGLYRYITEIYRVSLSISAIYRRQLYTSSALLSSEHSASLLSRCPLHNIERHFIYLLT